jgi:uncharacterized membrane protein YbhN (UPF0104 family)
MMTGNRRNEPSKTAAIAAQLANVDACSNLEVACADEKAENRIGPKATSEIVDLRKSQPRAPRAWLRIALPLFFIVIAGLCIFAIRRALAPGGFGSIWPALQRVSPLDLAASAASVVGVYAVVWAMEQVSLRDANAPETARMKVAVPLIVNALAAGAGFGIMSGGTLRARLYAPAGVTPMTAFVAASCLTFISILGGGFLASLGLALADVRIAGLIEPAVSVWFRLIGVFGLLALIGLALTGGSHGRKLRFAANDIHLPSTRGFLWRIGLGAVDWVFSALALYVLLPQAVRPAYFDFAATFATFQLVALSTGAPGGLGVFEAMMLSFGYGHASPEQMAASLICYRMTSFVVPVLLGLAGLAILEALRRKRKVRNEAPADAG